MSRTVPCLSAAAIGFVCLVGNAIAAEMTGAELKEFLTGKSVYTELTASVTGAQGLGVIYYDPNGTVLYKTPKGVIWHGTWTIKDNTACVDWKESPNNPCTKYDKQGDAIMSINVATGVARGKVVKTAPGNAENLAP